MNPKERVLESVSHRRTDRVPVDYWATEKVDQELIEYMGVSNREEFLHVLGIDIRYVFPPYIGPPLRTFPDGSQEDIWGVRRKEVKTGSGKIDILLIGDDLGTQNDLLMSPVMLKQFIFPYLRECIELCRGYKVRVMFHSCGAIKGIIPDLIELGIEILNPIQVRANGMILSELKNTFGDRLCFHERVDIQQTLPRGKPDDVKKEVRERIAVLGENGGYILAPTHNFQEEVPMENILAFYHEAGSMSYLI